MGIAEHFVPDRTTAAFVPVRKDVSQGEARMVVDMGVPLVESLDTGQIDLAIATRTDGKGRPGQLLFQEPLVWVASNDFRLDLSDSVPLALKPDPCQFRDEALAALQRVGWPWTSSYAGKCFKHSGCGPSGSWGECSRCAFRSKRNAGLPSIDIMLFGEEKFGGAIAKALVDFVLRSVQEQENLLSKAA